MLCLPEFDTYHILPEYARNPEDQRNRLALKILKHRALTAMNWRVLNCHIVNEKIRISYCSSRWVTMLPG